MDASITLIVATPLHLVYLCDGGVISPGDVTISTMVRTMMKLQWCIIKQASLITGFLLHIQVGSCSLWGVVSCRFHGICDSTWWCDPSSMTFTLMWHKAKTLVTVYWYLSCMIILSWSISQIIISQNKVFIWLLIGSGENTRRHHKVI